MNYLLHYNNLIKRATNRTIDSSLYYEKHHVIPKCIGGTDASHNIVMLLPEEHYVAHQLLAKIHPNNDSLIYACVMMCSGLSKRNNKSYSWIRRLANGYHSVRIKNAWAMKYGFEDYNEQADIIWNLYVINKTSTASIRKMFNMSKSNITQTLKWYASTHNLNNDLLETRKYFKSKNSKITRENISPEAEAFRIEQTKNADYSKRNAEMSVSRMGASNPVFGLTWKAIIVKCPHCEKMGGISQMKRWHFDNCKRRM